MYQVISFPVTSPVVTEPSAELIATHVKPVSEVNLTKILEPLTQRVIEENESPLNFMFCFLEINQM